MSVPSNQTTQTAFFRGLKSYKHMKIRQAMNKKTLSTSAAALVAAAALGACYNQIMVNCPSITLSKIVADSQGSTTISCTATPKPTDYVLTSRDASLNETGTDHKSPANFTCHDTCWAYDRDGNGYWLSTNLVVAGWTVDGNSCTNTGTGGSGSGGGSAN